MKSSELLAWRDGTEETGCKPLRRRESCRMGQIPERPRGGDAQNESILTGHSALAQHSFANRGQSADFYRKRDRLDPDSDDYFVDFHWSSGSNLPFFSIGHVPVKVS